MRCHPICYSHKAHYVCPPDIQTNYVLPALTRVTHMLHINWHILLSPLRFIWKLLAHNKQVLLYCNPPLNTPCYSIDSSLHQTLKINIKRVCKLSKLLSGQMVHLWLTLRMGRGDQPRSPCLPASCPMFIQLLTTEYIQNAGANWRKTLFLGTLKTLKGICFPIESILSSGCI